MRLKAMLAVVLSCIPYAKAEMEWQSSTSIDLSTRQYNGSPMRASQLDREFDAKLMWELDFENPKIGLSGGLKPVLSTAKNEGIRAFDIQEAYITRSFSQGQLNVGVNTVFWGVAESRHLVDIVNQKQPTRNLDNEAKLGELLLHYQHFTDNGHWFAMSLPYFRERDFGLPDDRLSLPLAVTDEQFVGRDANYRGSYLLGYRGVLGDWDVGTYYFDGIDREPVIRPNNNQEFDAIYRRLQQTALDLQWTSEYLLGKVEAVHRHHQMGGKSWAYVVGAEYYFYGIANSNKDLSLLMELHRDTEEQVNLNRLYQDATFIGMRLAWNDVDDTSMITGVLIDNDTGAHTIKTEFSTRLSSHLSLALEANLFLEQTQRDATYGFKDDDFIELRLTYYL